MTDELKAIIADAIEADSAARRDYESWQARPPRASSAGMICKDFPPERQLPYPTQTAEPTMTLEEEWSRWFDAMLWKQFDDKYIDAITEFVGTYVQEHLAPLKNEIGALRAELEVLRSV